MKSCIMAVGIIILCINKLETEGKFELKSKTKIAEWKALCTYWYKRYKRKGIE